MRLSVAMAVAWLSVSILSAAEPAQAVVRQSTSIPAQSLGSALQTLAKQRAFQVVYLSDAVDTMKTEGASGDLTPDEALKQLLSGTGLTYRYLDQATVTVFPENAPQAMNGSSGALNGIGEVDPIAIRQAQSSTTDTPVNTEKTATSSDPQKDMKKLMIEEIVVTAQKREERAIDVPMSIKALSGAKLTEAGIKNALDLSFAVPGLTVLETGPGQQGLIVRGVFSQRGTSSLTGVYLDEIPLSGVQGGNKPAYADIRTIDLARVEVLKGPQGTLFGEGAAGGVVRFITNDPDLSRAGGSISAEFSNTADGEWNESVTGVVNVPLATDVFGVRVAGSYENNSGWIDQPTIGRENINDADVKHVRAKALYMPIPELQIKGLIEIHRDDGGASYFVNQTPYDDSNFRQAFDLSAPTDYTNDYDLYNLTASYDFGFAELLSSTSYAKLEGVENFTQLVDGVPVPYFEALSRSSSTDAEITSQEVRLTSATSGPLKWTLGAAYKASELGVSYSQDAIAQCCGLVITGIGAGQRNMEKSESWAGFADVSYELLNNFEVGGGLRYFYDQRENFNAANLAAGVASGSFNRLTYRTYGKYKFSESANLYASVATGFRSGGFNPLPFVARGAPPAIGEENTKFYEAGAKAALLGGRLRVDGALFYGEYSGMQEQFTELSTIDGAPLTYTINGQDAELRGVEWDIAWAATNRLSLSLAGNVTDTEITRIKPGVATPYALDDSINMVPKYSLSANTDYRFKWSESVSGFFLLTFNRQGRSSSVSRNSALVLVKEVEAPEKDFLNASIGTEWSGWELSLFGRNLLDESSPLFPTTSGWSAQARPRTFGVIARKAF